MVRFQMCNRCNCGFQVWVLDATPGLVRAGGSGEDHPEELIAALRDMPLVVWMSPTYFYTSSYCLVFSVVNVGKLLRFHQGAG